MCLQRAAIDIYGSLLYAQGRRKEKVAKRRPPPLQPGRELFMKEKKIKDDADDGKKRETIAFIKKNIKIIIACIAILNLIWLFGFEYNIPGIGVPGFLQ